MWRLPSLAASNPYQSLIAAALAIAAMMPFNIFMPRLFAYSNTYQPTAVRGVYASKSGSESTSKIGGFAQLQSATMSTRHQAR